MSSRILIVEDDDIIASGLTYALEQEGYTVWRSQSVQEACLILADTVFDLALLDLQLPDGSGFELVDTLKQSAAAVIFLTVVDDEGNVVRAFASGADDYITKPFRLQELLARVKRTLKAGSTGEHNILTLGKVRIDTTAAKASVGEEMLELTALEYRLLLTFASHKGRILTRAQILESLWDAAGSYVEDNTLTVYIKRLREKLGSAATIETVRGLGYRAN